MQILSSTLIAVAFLAWLLRQGPHNGMLVMFFAIPFGMMAAFNLPAVGGMSILASDLVVVVSAILLLFYTRTMDDLGRVLAPGRAGLALLGFLLYATVATIFFPRIFAGATDVFSISRSANESGIELRPLAPGNGNLSQLFRLVLSVLVFAIAALAMMRQRAPAFALRAVIVVTLVHAALGLIDIATQLTGTTDIMAPLRTANYALTLGQKMAGLNRMIGGFPEASSYSYVSLSLFGFWLSYWYDNRGGQRWPLALMVLTLFLVLRGTSSSAYVGAGLLVVIFAAVRLFSGGRGGGTIDRKLAGALIAVLAILPLAVIGIYMAYALVPAVTDFIDRSLLDKLASESGVERMSWNMQALRNFLDTYLLGAGLGSIRASNWLTATLGTTGLVGFGLMLVFLWRVFRVPLTGLNAEGRLVATALKMGLAGSLSRALVVKATPNLDYIFFAMAGLLIGMTIVASRARATAPATARGLALE